MTKTLTEQWENETLKSGFYWLKVDVGGGEYIDIVEYDEDYCDFIRYWDDCIKEVIAPVPGYEEYKELVRKSDKLDKIMYDSATNQGDCQQIVEDNLNRQIERLQEQLNEANEVIKWYDMLENILICWEMATGQPAGTAKKYLDKWGVKRKTFTSFL